MVFRQVERLSEGGVGNQKIIDEELASDIDRTTPGGASKEDDEVLLDRGRKVSKAGRPARENTPL
jgi:hypothetical protein